MTNAPEVLTIDVWTEVPDWTDIGFQDEVSTHDFDLVIWSPNGATGFPETFHGSWEGRPVLGQDSARQLVAALQRRATEFDALLKSGGDLIIFASEVGLVYGPDREPISAWDLFQYPVGITPANGKKIEVVDRGPLGDFVRACEAEVSYRVTFPVEQFDDWEPIAIVGKANAAVAAVRRRAPDEGRIILLPFMRFVMEESDDESDSFWTSLVQAVVASRPVQSDEPSWASDYAGEAEFAARSAIAGHLAAIARAEAELVELRTQESETKRAKPLLYAQGSELEDAVLFVLESFGGERVVGTQKNRVDHIIDFGDWRAVVEVKGIRGSAGEKNAAQLEKWMTELEDRTNAKPLLVVNAYREQAPAERGDAFPHQMWKYAKSREHGLLTSSQLYAMFEEVQARPDILPSVVEELRTTVGVFSGHSVDRFFRTSES